MKFSLKIVLIMVLSISQFLMAQKEYEAIGINNEAKNQNIVTQKENILIIEHEFTSPTENAEYLGVPISINLQGKAGGMLSGYSLSETNYRLFYRVLEDEHWTHWIELKDETEGEAINRRSFSINIISNSSKKIQFKSDSATSSEVYFRIFIIDLKK